MSYCAFRKIKWGRHRTQKFQSGHIKYCGETALTTMDVGYAVATKKLGTIGCTVAIMRAGTKLHLNYNQNKGRIG